MDDGVLALIGLAVFILIIMVICNVVRNAILSGRDSKKKERDRQMGLYQESRQENLSDRFKY